MQLTLSDLLREEKLLKFEMSSLELWVGRMPVGVENDWSNTYFKIEGYLRWNFMKSTDLSIGYGYNVAIEKLAEELAVPQDRFDQAEKRYKDLGDFLHREASKVRDFDPDVYIQGSFALGTPIKQHLQMKIMISTSWYPLGDCQKAIFARLIFVVC